MSTFLQVFGELPDVYLYTAEGVPAVWRDLNDPHARMVVGEGNPGVGSKPFLTVRNELCVVSVDGLVCVRRSKYDLARDSRQHDDHTYTTKREAIRFGDSQ